MLGSEGEQIGTVEGHESGGGCSEIGGSSSVPAEELGGGGGGNRWPREETLALLRIRSEMDATFRDSSLKGLLWEEVSRKMAALGFRRRAKQCKEKFENVYKYHKRTKDGRAAKSDGKTYRFFDQLEALENSPAPAPSISPTPLSIVHPQSGNPTNPFQQSQPQFDHQDALPRSVPAFRQSPADSIPTPTPTPWPSSSSTSSDEDVKRRHGRKRKWRDYLEQLMREVVQQQEALQKKFLDTLERQDRDRRTREETWRAQEIARMNREHDVLVREKSAAAAIIAFLRKVTPDQIQPTVPPPPPPSIQPQLLKNPPPLSKPDSGEEITEALRVSSPPSLRWPEAEIEALIDLRTRLEQKYQDSGLKGPLWEEVSAAMAEQGFRRSAKRCKEKWENINKYYKKVKESSKCRPQDSNCKICPYFHHLEAIYKEKAMTDPQFRPLQRPDGHRNLGYESGNNDRNEDDFNDDETRELELILNKQPPVVANGATAAAD